MAAVTRLGLYGGARGLYGSFSGKAEAPIVVVPDVDAGAGSGGADEYIQSAEDEVLVRYTNDPAEAPAEEEARPESAEVQPAPPLVKPLPSDEKLPSLESLEAKADKLGDTLDRLEEDRDEAKAKADLLLLLLLID